MLQLWDWRIDLNIWYRGGHTAMVVDDDDLNVHAFGLDRSCRHLFRVHTGSPRSFLVVNSKECKYTHTIRFFSASYACGFAQSRLSKIAARSRALFPTSLRFCFWMSPLVTWIRRTRYAFIGLGSSLCWHSFMRICCCLCSGMCDGRSDRWM